MPRVSGKWWVDHSSYQGGLLSCHASGEGVLGTVGVVFLQGESPAEEALQDDGRSLERSSLSCPGTGMGKCLAKGDFMSEVDKPPGADAQRWDPPVPGAARSWDCIWEAEAEGWFAAIDGEGCVQPSVLVKRGVGAGGLAAGERRAHSCQQGRKSRYISVRLKGRGSAFLMLQMYRDKRIVPHSVLFILCL